MSKEQASVFNQTSAAFMELAANRLLALDAEAHLQLEKFKDKVIQIQIEDLALNYFILFPGGSLVVQTNSQRPVSAAVRGKLSAFLGSLTSNHSGDAVFQGDLHFSGEINTARQFQHFVQSLQLDWQQPLSNLFGDLMANQIAQSINGLGSFISQLANNVRQDIPEYIQHEIQVTPSQPELNEFLTQVDIARSQADRLQARIQRLQHND